jgi:hypothetical protein
MGGIFWHSGKFPKKAKGEFPKKAEGRERKREG